MFPEYHQQTQAAATKVVWPGPPTIGHPQYWEYRPGRPMRTLPHLTLTRTPHRRSETPTPAHARHATDDGVLDLAALACPAARARRTCTSCAAVPLVGVCAAARRCTNNNAKMGLGEDSGGVLLFQEPSTSPALDLARRVSYRSRGLMDWRLSASIATTFSRITYAQRPTQRTLIEGVV
ncbi:hypothetical protein C8R45DRAFT_1152811 [Mycena sanguinolenta]|nr:hypothetical protein C8R45DRAFT_1152811 [Mycena sanguinolenta]